MKDRHHNRKAQQDRVIPISNSSNTSLYKSFTAWQPLTDNQSLAAQLYNEKEQCIILQAGSAGTGKTAWAFRNALQDLVNGDCERVLFIRNIVSARDTGFLPGSIGEKFAPFLAVASSIVNEMFGRGDAFECLVKSNRLIATCSSFLQGHTFDNCRIIVDEVQNMNWQEISMLITRMGHNSKMIMCGDDRQDMLTCGHHVTGWYDMLDIFEKMPSVAIVEYDQDDIVRSDIVREFIIAAESYFSQYQ